MKAQVSKILLLILISASVLAQRTENCNGKFLLAMKNSLDPAISSIVLTSPQAYTGEVCKAEWNGFKTCCDATKINDVATKYIEDWKTKIENFNKQLTILEPMVLPKIEELKLITSEINTLLNNNTSRLSLISTNKIDSTSADIILKLTAQGDTILTLFDKEFYEAEKKKYTDGITKCFETIRNLRSGAICFWCSARATDFETAGGLMKLSTSACVDVVKECRHSFFFMLRVNQALKIFNSLKITEAAGTPSTTPKITLADGDKTVADNIASVLVELKTVATLPDAAITGTDEVKNVCNRLLSVRGGNSDIEGNEIILANAVVQKTSLKAKLEALPPAEVTAMTTKITARRSA
jgi:hypothetical protein